LGSPQTLEIRFAACNDIDAASIALVPEERGAMRFSCLLLVMLAAFALSTATAFGGVRAGGVTVVAGPSFSGPPPKGLTQQSDALSFFPKVATVHVGETVTWQFHGFHTATFPGPKRPYPFIVPLGGTEPATNDAAGDPFWWAGTGPLLGISPLSLLPEGPSTISSPAQVRSSGLIRVVTATRKRPPAPYTLTFTRPGTYHYECVVHSGMRGIVRVLPASSSVPSPAAEQQQGAVEIKHTVADLLRLNHTKPSRPLTVLVGAGHNATGAEIATMFPSKLAVNVGDTVTFRNNDETDVHTVTFGPEKLRARIETTFISPQGKRILLNPLGAFASESPGSDPVTYDGSNHGNGYVNSGLLFPKGAPAQAGPQVYKVTFALPGTYHYECVIHSHMDGTIVVH
jgi:plastocyanin